MFDPLSLFHPSLICPDKAGAYLRRAHHGTALQREAPSLGRQILDKDSHEHSSLHLMELNMAVKSVIAQAPDVLNDWLNFVLFLKQILFKIFVQSIVNLFFKMFLNDDYSS